MASGTRGFPSPLTGGGDPTAPGNVAQGLKALSPTRGLVVKLAFSSRVAEAGAPIRPQENFATDSSFLNEMGVNSPRTDGLADDRTRGLR